MTDDIEIDIIELPKIHNGNTKNEDGLLEWLYFLENPESEGVERIMKKNEGIKKAKEKLEEISDDIIMQRLADWEEAAERDLKSVRNTAIDEGRKEGIEKGMTEGMEKGREEGKLELIMEMLKNEVDEDFIVKISGVTKEKILQIKKNMSKIEEEIKFDK